jgi:hypothetical protein
LTANDDGQTKIVLPYGSLDFPTAASIPRAINMPQMTPQALVARSRWIHWASIKGFPEKPSKGLEGASNLGWCVDCFDFVVLQLLLAVFSFQGSP